MPKQLCLFGIVMCLLSSCTDVIEMDLEHEGPVIVIDGAITNEATGNEIKITTTTDVNEKNEFPPVTDATVTVDDLTSGESETLSQIYPGVYSIEVIKGIPGHKYLLRVVIGSSIYEATSIMPEPVDLESIGYYTAALPQGDEIRMTATYTDPVILGNNYRFVIHQNGIQSRSIFVRNDAFTNGNNVEQVIFNAGVKIETNDKIDLEMQCIDDGAYNYLNGLMLLQSDRGIAPTNPETNLSGGALGYFSAYCAQRKSISIE